MSAPTSVPTTGVDESTKRVHYKTGWNQDTKKDDVLNHVSSLKEPTTGTAPRQPARPRNHNEVVKAAKARLEERPIQPVSEGGKFRQKSYVIIS